MFGHILCGCSKVGLFEGMEMMKESLTNGKPARRAAVANNVNNNANVNNANVNDRNEENEEKIINQEK
jgi:hypothetical protein